MKSNRIKILVAALVLAVAGTVAVSQTAKHAHWRHGGMFGGHALAFFTHYLDLTDSQQAQVKDIMVEEKPTLQPLFQQLAQARHQMRPYEEGGKFDEAQVRVLATQQAQTITELMVQKARIESEMVKVLNPDQKAKLTQFFDRREARFHTSLEQQPNEPTQ